MALSNWSELQTALNSYLGTNFYADQYGTWARLIEARVDRELRTRDQETVTTETLSGPYLDLDTDPTDWLEFSYLQIEANGKPVELVQESPQNYARFSDGVAGQPRWFHIKGNRLYTRPAPDGSYTLTLAYYSKVPGIEANAQNWLLTDHPDIYLYGMLSAAADFKRDDGATIPVGTASRWNARYEAAWSMLEKMDQRARFSGALPTIQTDVAAV